MKIKKYMCIQHNLITSRKGLRNHIKDNHAKDDFTKTDVWHTEKWSVKNK